MKQIHSETQNNKKCMVVSYLFLVLSAMLICFIFANSLQPSVVSNGSSQEVAHWLEPWLDPFDWLPSDTFHKVVRKLAHFTEFAALGAVLGGLTISLECAREKWWKISALVSLCVACMDEIIQSFTGRTNSLKDVAIDFSGAVFGLLIVAGVLLLSGLRKERRG